MLISNGSYEIFQVNSSDALVRQSAYEASTGRFTVPKRTTAVFVEPRCWWMAFASNCIWHRSKCM